VGPTLAGVLYDIRGIEWPYLGGAWVAGAAFIVALFLHDPKRATPSSEENHSAPSPT